jgi:ABC-2 type transport system ATP-binding protein
MPYKWLRTGDLIRHHAGYYPSWDDAYAAHLSRVLEIRPDVKYGELSKGQARRVQLLLALAHRPPLLLLDEPTDGLDPVARDRVQGVLAEHIADTTTTVLVATHLVYEMERFADHVGVLQGGRLLLQVPRHELHARLRRYVFEVPDGWRAELVDTLPLVRQNGTPRERRWTIWGDEAEVTASLTAAGGHVRSVSTLTLDEAALALLSPENA